MKNEDLRGWERLSEYFDGISKRPFRDMSRPASSNRENSRSLIFYKSEIDEAIKEVD